jgi:hypothetical protein
VRCVLLRQQKRRRGFLKKLGKIPGVRASENASTTNAVRAIAGHAPCQLSLQAVQGDVGGYAAGQSSAPGVAATASSACSVELRAGLGDLRHRGIKPPVSRALGRPTAFLDWHRSFGSGVTRSPPLFEAPPDVSGPHFIQTLAKSHAQMEALRRRDSRAQREEWHGHRRQPP